MYNIDMVPEVNTAIIRGDLPELSGIGNRNRQFFLPKRLFLAIRVDHLSTMLNFLRGTDLSLSFELNKMDESELTRHLKTISKRPVPSLPSNLAGSVWAKIGRAEAAIRESWLDILVSTLLRPQWATAVLAITLLIGGNLGRVLVNSENPIHKPLGFEVFAADAPTLPSTLLGGSR
jgi:hypothetical protein